jgi:hypothetical protein
MVVVHTHVFPSSMLSQFQLILQVFKVLFLIVANYNRIIEDSSTRNHYSGPKLRSDILRHEKKESGM